MTTPENKEDNKPALIIMACAAGLYACVMFWYIAVPVLIIAGVIFYMAYKKNPKLQAKMKEKFGGMWPKFKKFMQR
jgi:type II secretory pathway component PulF